MDDRLIARSAFDGIRATRNGDGVRIVDRDGLGIATVIARGGRADGLAERVRSSYGIELPTGPRRATGGDGSVAFAGTGPGSWLATMDDGGNAFAQSLGAQLAGVASVSDQSDGHAVLRLSGPRVRDALAKMVPIDLHPDAYPVGAFASTMAGHIGLSLWRVRDAADGSAVYELAVFRSMAMSLWHALDLAAAEYGVTIAGST